MWLCSILWYFTVLALLYSIVLNCAVLYGTHPRQFVYHAICLNSLWTRPSPHNGIGLLSTSDAVIAFFLIRIARIYLIGSNYCQILDREHLTNTLKSSPIFFPFPYYWGTAKQQNIITTTTKQQQQNNITTTKPLPISRIPKGTSETNKLIKRFCFSLTTKARIVTSRLRNQLLCRCELR